MDFFDTVAGREFTEMTVAHLQTIAECLEVIANYIIEKQKQGKAAAIEQEK